MSRPRDSRPLQLQDQLTTDLKKYMSDPAGHGHRQSSKQPDFQCCGRGFEAGILSAYSPHDGTGCHRDIGRLQGFRQGQEDLRAANRGRRQAGKTSVQLQECNQGSRIRSRILSCSRVTPWLCRRGGRHETSIRAVPSAIAGSSVSGRLGARRDAPACSGSCVRLLSSSQEPTQTPWSEAGIYGSRSRQIPELSGRGGEPLQSQSGNDRCRRPTIPILPPSRRSACRRCRI